MWRLLAIKPIDVIIGAVAAAIVLGVIVWAIIRKKQGKSVTCDCSSCDGCCSGCNKTKQS